jgi:glycosyltransferase involved in cell wall biosynthesis
MRGKKINMPDFASICLLTQYYPPEIGAPQARLHEMMKRLVERGIKVEVITAVPNYPVGKVSAGYDKFWYSREEIDGVDVLRVPIYPSVSSHIIPRFISYMSFVFTSLLFGIFFARRSDVLVYESPPLFLGFSALPLSRWLGAKRIMNVSDLWPESIVRLDAASEGFVLRVLLWLEKLFYARADAITGQSPGIVDAIQAIAPEQKVSLISNGCDCKIFNPNKSDRAIITELGWNDRIVVGYAGLIGLAQGIELFVRVAKALQDHKNIGFLLIGSGPEYKSLKSKAEEAGLDNIQFVGPRAKSEMPQLVASFDMSIVPLRTFIPGALPSKLYETMASAVPIILCAEGDPADLVQKSGSGVIVPFDQTDNVAKSVLELATNPELRRSLGKSGRAYVEKHHDRDSLAAKFHALLDEIVAG